MSNLFNVSRPPFDDVRVRRAIQLATDLDDFNEKAADGQQPLLDAYYTEDSPYYDPDVVQQTNDLEAAQALIDEYVAEKGGPVKFELLGATTFKLINTVLQQQWSRLENVEITFTELANTNWRARQAAGTSRSQRASRTGAIRSASTTSTTPFDGQRNAQRQF